MNHPPILYIGSAAPLVEAGYLWLAEIPPCDDEKAKREKLKAFPHNQIGAYGLSFQNGVALRAKDAANWQDAAIVHISGETPIEVSACVAFQSMFFPELLRGETVGDAFDNARRYVENDPAIGDLSVAPGETPPSEKFRLNDAGREITLPHSISSPPCEGGVRGNTFQIRENFPKIENRNHHEFSFSGRLNSIFSASDNSSEAYLKGIAAKDSYTEALEIYAPLVAQWPRAFQRVFSLVLGNYASIAPEQAGDPWWAVWKGLNAEA